MTLLEYREKYQGLSQADVQSKALYQPDEEFKQATEALYVTYFRQSINKSCGDCWKDAYVLLMLTKKDNTMENQRLFDLKAGAILYDVVNNDNSLMCTTLNITDELALYHLSKNPAYISKFSQFPDNWSDLVNDYIAKSAPKTKVQTMAVEAKVENAPEVKQSYKSNKKSRK